MPIDRCIDCDGRVPLPDVTRPDAPAPRCPKCGARGGPGYAVQTVRNRTAVVHLWNTLDGKSAPNPVRDAPAPRKTDPEARGLPFDVVMGIINRMPDQGRAKRGDTRPAASKTKIRLRCTLWRGIPPAQIGRIKRRDLNLAEQFVIITGRKKGGGTKTRRVDLDREALDAFRDFDRHDCYGTFSTSSVSKSFQIACRHLGLEGIRLYGLHHSFLPAVYAATGDLTATATAGDHSTLDLTRRYTLAARDTRLTMAIERFRETPPANFPPTPP